MALLSLPPHLLIEIVRLMDLETVFKFRLLFVDLFRCFCIWIYSFRRVCGLACHFVSIARYLAIKRPMRIACDSEPFWDMYSWEERSNFFFRIYLCQCYDSSMLIGEFEWYPDRRIDFAPLKKIFGESVDKCKYVFLL